MLLRLLRVYNIMDYQEDDSSFIFNQPEEDYHQYPRKKSTNSTQYSFKNFQYDSIDQYLVLDRNVNNANEPRVPRMKPLNNQQAIRLRNKINAKKSRDRKKNQFQKVSYRLKELQHENFKINQMRKFCTRCKTRLIDSTLSTITQEKQLKEQRKIEIEFEKPEFKPQKSQAGKIWIAVGIIMLILGINIHGVSHQDPLQINLKNSAIINFKDQLKANETSNFKLPLNFGNDMEEKKPIEKEGLLDISLTGLRIKSIDDKDKAIEENPVQDEVFQVSRDFLFQLQGQINDIGRYI